MPVSTQEKRAAFRKLHEAGCFVLPNPWDVGGARALAHLGFKAIAATSAGYARRFTPRPFAEKSAPPQR